MNNLTSLIPNGDSNQHNPVSLKTSEMSWKWSLYIGALRPWSFTASLIPVLIGACLSYKTHKIFDIQILIVVSLTALAVHAAGNLVNTYYDYKKGVDNKKSDDKTLFEGKMTLNDVVTLGAVCYCIGCFGLAVLWIISPARQQLLSLVYFCGLSGSFLYTGGLGLKYVALGDIVIFLTFGPLTVLFAYLSLTGDLSSIIIPYAIPLAMNIECILHANNCRDEEPDGKAGIITLAIFLGKAKSYFLFCFLLFSPYIFYLYVTVNYSVWFILPSLTMVFTFGIERSFRSGNLTKLPQRIAELNLILGFSFAGAILLTPANKLPFL